MTDLILHHFASSPFSEKIRLIFGYKRLAWRSVEVPMYMPKPDVVALTGGYRRTPFLQIGADIFCDTALMARVIDRHTPQPPLYPANGMAHMLAQWADSGLFWAAVPYTSSLPAALPHLIGNAMPTPEFLKGLVEDRAAMLGSTKRATPLDAAAQLTSYLGWLDSAIAGPFLLGEQPCIADFAAAQSIWFLRLAPPAAAVLAPYAKITAWYERIEAFGRGTPTPMSPAEAISIAAAGGHVPTTVDPGGGFEAGAPVTVCASDYASDLVTGTLVGLAHDEVVIERRDERAGTVHVHFPRIGYQVRRVK